MYPHTERYSQLKQFSVCLTYKLYILLRSNKISIVSLWGKEPCLQHHFDHAAALSVFHHLAMRTTQAAAGSMYELSPVYTAISGHNFKFVNQQVFCNQTVPHNASL